MGGGNTSAIRKCFQQHDFKFNLFLHSVSFRCEADGKWRAVDDFGLIPICLPGNIPLSALPLVLQELFSNDIVPSVCGKPRVDFFGIHRIIGGNDALQGSIPWQVRISGGGGGMLIADRWVLTAAHVLSPYMQPRPTKLLYFVLFLQMFWGTNTWSDFPVPNAIAASVHLHPGYNNPAHLNFDNDIALIKLPAPVTFHKFVIPICLPENNRGLQENELGTKLKHVPIPVYSEQKCRATPDVKMQYTQNMFCAGADGKDSCEKDSGGPYFVPALDAVRPFRLMGIVSWGASCYQREHKGYYTKVENYVQWIRDTIEATEESLKQQESE
uniref:trypsin n=1 Tax=Neogobius melanostomus TaxID=47308 RepID=A0A8C6SLL8_9GOBI